MKRTAQKEKFDGRILETVALLQTVNDSPLKMCNKIYPTKLDFVWPYTDSEMGHP